MRVALVLGGGACVWDDVERALELGEYAGVVSCNDITAAWPGPIDACVSLHASSWPRWITQRDRAGLPRPARICGHTEGAGGVRSVPIVTDYLEFRVPGQQRSGSSGLFALKVALWDLGFDRAVLCGVPMTAEERHFFEPKHWRGAQGHRKGWEEAFPAIRDRARSMSGWTRDLLGEPDAEWLTSSADAG